jgi:hypothetical protein
MGIGIVRMSITATIRVRTPAIPTTAAAIIAIVTLIQRPPETPKSLLHCKKVSDFPVPSREVTNQTLYGREKI